jgi:3-oxoadipate enol-lactonase/4-carboxymuconolactone decarboxylase
VLQAAAVDGRTIEYRLDGPEGGPVLAFSNSLGTDLRVWDPLLPHLPQGLRLLRTTKAGHGLSDLAGARAIEDHARDLLAVMDRCSIETCALVGLSVGGLIALAASELAPERFRGFVFCCTAHRIGQADVWNQRIADVEDKGLGAMADGVMERWFSEDFRTNRPGDLALWRNMLARQPAEGYAALCAAIRDADFTEAAKKIAVPALCVAGTEDGSTPPEVVAGLRGLVPGATMETIEGAGHIPCVEAPDRLGALISGFLKEHGLA